jgi:hypothetical protein
MAIDIFEGSRRVMWVLVALWVLGTGAVFLADSPAVDVRYRVPRPNSEPQRVTDRCSFEDAQESDYFRRTSKGTSYNLTLCFPAYEFPSGRLIPYKIDKNGSMWGDHSYSSEVILYTDATMKRFNLLPADEQWIDDQATSAMLRHWREAAQIAALGAVAIWIAASVIGWVARGFLGKAAVGPH